MVRVSPAISPTSRASSPVASIPTIPPTPWHGNTSSVSSSVDFDFMWTAQLLTSAATTPMNTLWPMDTNPAAGVMATRPTTAPMHAPRAEGLRPRAVSNSIHVSIAAAEAVFVVTTAIAAVALAPNDDPALNPNQPNHNIPVPRSTYGMF